MSNEFKLVPVEPTSEMTFVGQGLRYDPVNSIGEIYRRMLAAAPQPPALGGEPEVLAWMYRREGGEILGQLVAIESDDLKYVREGQYCEGRTLLTPRSDYYGWQALIDRAHVAPLQAEIERQSTVIDRQKNLIQSLRDELTESYAVGSADRLKAWCDELEHRATDVVEGLDGEELPGAMTMRIRKLKAALSKPAGSEQ